MILYMYIILWFCGNEETLDFSISDEQRELLSRLDEFCDMNLREDLVRRWYAEGGVPDSFMQSYYNEGFGLIGFPERMNGIPSSVLTRVLMLERLGLRAGATLPMSSIMNYANIVSSVANDQQMDEISSYFEKTGRPSFSFAISEPQAGSDSLNARTVAIEQEDGFVIRGTKSFVSFGQYAPYVVLIAHDVALDDDIEVGRKPLTFFFLPSDSEGIDIIPIPKLSQNLIPSAEIIFNEVFVDASAVMGVRGEAARLLLNSFDYGRLYLCATSIGMAQAAFNQAMVYATNRKTTNRTILSFQQVQEMVVDMQIKIDSMRSLLYKTAREFEDSSSEERRLNAAMLKRYVPRAAMEVADSAMQILGSNGFMSTSLSARVWEESRGYRIAEGTDQIMTVIAAKRIARRSEFERSDPPVWRF